MNGVVKFKQSNTPKQSGEIARLKVVKGPDFGCVFVMKVPRIVIGRGEGNDVVISDLKASRVHAEVAQLSNGWTVRDLGSANGILFRGQSVRTAQLRPGEIFTVGETTLEFVPAEVGTQALVAPPKSSTKLDQIQSAYENNQDRLKAITSFGGGADLKSIGKPSGGGNKPKPITIIVLAIGALFLIWDEAPKLKVSKGKKVPTAKSKRNLAAFLPKDPVNKDVAKTSRMFFRAGFREYRERNFLRAKKQFETVLQINPGHKLANLYLNNCDQAIEEEVKFHLDRGSKSLSAGKLSEAKGHYETILRLLYRDRSNEAFIEASEKLKEVQTAMRGDLEQ